jgi:hypothetical protein
MQIIERGNLSDRHKKLKDDEAAMLEQKEAPG